MAGGWGYALLSRNNPMNAREPADTNLAGPHHWHLQDQAPVNPPRVWAITCVFREFLDLNYEIRKHYTQEDLAVSCHLLLLPHFQERGCTNWGLLPEELVPFAPAKASFLAAITDNTVPISAQWCQPAVWFPTSFLHSLKLFRLH